MKAIHNYIWMFSLMLLLAGCAKTGLMKYESEANVYFPHKSNIDTIGYTFSKDTLKFDTVRVAVNRMGKGAGRAFFRLVYDATSTAVKDVDFIMPADTSMYFAPDSASRTLFVIVKRAASLQEKRRKIEFSLKADDVFSTNLQPVILTNDTIYYNRITVSIDDILVQPTWWTTYVAYMGTFSRKKTELFVTFLNGLLSYKTLVASGGSYSGILRDQSKLFQAYLNQKAAAGETIYEEDGSIMKMGASAQ